MRTVEAIYHRLVRLWTRVMDNVKPHEGRLGWDRKLGCGFCRKARARILRSESSSGARLIAGDRGVLTPILNWRSHGPFDPAFAPEVGLVTPSHPAAAPPLRSALRSRAGGNTTWILGSHGAGLHAIYARSPPPRSRHRFCVYSHAAPLYCRATVVDVHRASALARARAID